MTTKKAPARASVKFYRLEYFYLKDNNFIYKTKIFSNSKSLEGELRTMESSDSMKTFGIGLNVVASNSDGTFYVNDDWYEKIPKEIGCLF